MTSITRNELLSSLISDIKAYSGKDPLLPWLQGVKKMKESLPSKILKEKLPRFLQKCATTFENDARYRNDLRYIRVWIQLMDFVEEPKLILRTMEKNRIGVKSVLFYQAYALYYEKLKRYEESEKMYHLGVQNFAEPPGELQKSYEKFLQRMEQHKNRRAKGLKATTIDKRIPLHQMENNIIRNERTTSKEMEKGNKKFSRDKKGKEPTSYSKEKMKNLDLQRPTDNTVVMKFVDSAIDGRSEPEDACHHGLVDPTVNMKEAMNAINSMFKEPIELDPRLRRPQKSRPQFKHEKLEVFIDEEVQNPINEINTGTLKKNQTTQKSTQPEFKIFVDEEENENEQISDGSTSNTPIVYGNPSVERSKDRFVSGKMKDDTVVCRFVGATIVGDPKLENVCHHGLVDPTINLKEAMDDINSMFGRPIEYKRPKKKMKPLAKTQSNLGFSILPDEDIEVQKPKIKTKVEHELFEPTMCTKEAMSEINGMFGIPLDF